MIEENPNDLAERLYKEGGQHTINMDGDPRRVEALKQQITTIRDQFEDGDDVLVVLAKKSEKGRVRMASAADYRFATNIVGYLIAKYGISAEAVLLSATLYKGEEPKKQKIYTGNPKTNED